MEVLSSAQYQDVLMLVHELATELVKGKTQKVDPIVDLDLAGLTGELELIGCFETQLRLNSLEAWQDLTAGMPSTRKLKLIFSLLEEVNTLLVRWGHYTLILALKNATDHPNIGNYFYPKGTAYPFHVILDAPSLLGGSFLKLVREVAPSQRPSVERLLEILHVLASGITAQDELIAKYGVKVRLIISLLEKYGIVHRNVFGGPVSPTVNLCDEGTTHELQFMR